MQTVQKAKITAAIMGVLTSIFGALAIPIICLVSSNIIDYLTGIWAAKYRKEKISSFKGYQGIIKKVCMWLLIVVGVIIDEILKYSTATIGLSIPFTFMVASIVAIWLVFNEIISILENVKDIGVDLPPFLSKLTENFKSKVEATTDIFNDESEEK